MSARANTTRRGLTLLELMLALTVTVVIGAGLASLLTVIGQSTAFDRDARTGSLRAHAAQVRLQAYSETALCVLQANDRGEFALWFEDGTDPGAVNLRELRVFWVSDEGVMTCERVVFPEEWTPAQKETFDVMVPLASDFFNTMQLMRGSGYTSSVSIVDGVENAEIDFDPATPVDAARLRYRFTQTYASGVEVDSLIAIALPSHTVPEI